MVIGEPQQPSPLAENHIRVERGDLPLGSCLVMISKTKRAMLKQCHDALTSSRYSIMASIYRLPVSLMSPEHAERKRAQDRVNQRYSRARRKSKVEELEQTNKNLLKRLADAEAEIARLRDREIAVRKVLGDAALNSAIGSEALDAQVGQIQVCTEGSLGELALLSRTSTSSTLLSASTATLESPQSLQDITIGSPCLCPTQQFSNACDLNPPFDFGETSTFSLLASIYIEQSTSQDLTPATHWHTTYDVIPQLGSYESIQSPSIHKHVLDKHPLPLHFQAKPLLGQLVLQNPEKGRQWKMRPVGHQHNELTQPSFPSISSLLNPRSVDDAEILPATAVSVHVRETMLTSFTIRVAMHYIVSMLLRWYATLSEDAYRALPENMRPTELQQTVPHAPWIDLLVWPAVRDAVIRQMQRTQSRLDDLQRLISTTLRIHWPYSDADVFLSSSDGKQMVLSPLFVSHIHDSRVSRVMPATVSSPADTKGHRIGLWTR